MNRSIKLLSIILFVIGLSNCQKKQGLTLAQQVSGTYIGLYEYKESVADYSITVEEISPKEVRIHSTSGNLSASFNVNLKETDLGNEKVIFLQFPQSTFQSHGSYVISSKKLSYNLHMGGTDINNVEKFSGIKK